jgi:hypothetical protein
MSLIPRHKMLTRHLSRSTRLFMLMVLTASLKLTAVQ